MSTDVDHCRHCGLLTSDMSPCCEQWERDQAGNPLTLDEAESMLRIWFGPGRPRDLAQLLMAEYERRGRVEAAARAYVDDTRPMHEQVDALQELCELLAEAAP